MDFFDEDPIRTSPWIERDWGAPQLMTLEEALLHEEGTVGSLAYRLVEKNISLETEVYIQIENNNTEIKAAKLWLPHDQRTWLHSGDGIYFKSRGGR